MANRYEIKNKIGRGGVGAIYKAYDKTLKRDVAIKRLLPIEETHLNDSTNHTLTREVDALSRLHHPNVINLFAFEEDEEGPYVVMEYIKGNTIRDIVKYDAMTLDNLINVANQTLDPLITAQELGLLHRDIKPDNIMLQWLSSGSFQVKILDFGLAKFSLTPSLQTLDQTGAFMGSIDYLAPEQLDRHPLDARTDLYSLGCVFYYCLTQRSPFEGDTPAETMSNHLDHTVTHISQIRQDVPHAIAEWLMLLIARQPEHRPENAKVALELFKQAREGNVPLLSVSETTEAHSSKEQATLLTATHEVVTSPVAIGPPGALSSLLSTIDSAPNNRKAAPAEISSPVLPPAKIAVVSTPAQTLCTSGPLPISTGVVAKTKRISEQSNPSYREPSRFSRNVKSPQVWAIAALTFIVIILTGLLMDEKSDQEKDKKINQSIP
ncbi:MAG: serine/threonine protein kinase [Verrucomicrobiales bacterium]|nr:serine/threonine protein kinase [Verrucomicrobiales bacterium]